MTDEPETIISFVLDKAIQDNPALVRRTMIDLMVQVAELEREIMKLKGKSENLLQRNRSLCRPVAPQFD